ncbi:MAG: heat-inducible transcription repressor HrcA [Clostridia bacterium]|nr:heat-inducible transcription repressor HrcA [Clostridia bacterium]MBQ7789397.1 heat-inducible transcription repressor HrcA [Clostridia bacterium]
MALDISELSDRKKLILKAIVEAHIKLGEPVGSKYLMQEANIGYSSATIRNEMAELEDLGYLEQPHTSAGRIPSEMGYRFYVDTLVTQYDATTREASELKKMLSFKMSEIDKILENATKVASAITNYTALSLRPRPSSITMKRYEAVYIDAHSYIIIMIASGVDSVKTRNVKLPYEVTPELISALSTVLNKNLLGLSINDINISVIMNMERELEEQSAKEQKLCAELISVTIKSIYETMNELGSEIKFEGVNRLLEYPEYKNLDKLQKMISTIENKEDIIRAVSTIDQSDDETKIFIGSENMVKIMDDSTLIYKNLKLNGKTIGAIGIIGPCRMDYSKVLATIDQLSEEINRLSDIRALPNANNEESDK